MAKLFGWGLGAVIAVLFAGISYRAYAQHRTAVSLAIRTPNGIDEGMFIRLGGMDQWVQIRGEDRDNPVILMLHGGPGMSYVPFTPFFRAWEKHFTIVQWDRRGVGKTYGKNGADSAHMTFDVMARDGVELADSLRKRLNKDKLILLGHSVGSVVGVLMVKRQPGLFYAYVGTDQIVDMATNESVSYRLLRERARGSADEKIKRDVETLESPPYTSGDRWLHKQRLISATDPVATSFENGLFKLIATAPNYTVKDMMALGTGLKYSAQALIGEMMTLDTRVGGTKFDVPMFIFEGANDVLDPTELAVAWFKTIDAPTKDLVIFDGAGHNAMLMRSDEFLAQLLGKVRPLALRP